MLATGSAISVHTDLARAHNPSSIPSGGVSTDAKGIIKVEDTDARPAGLLLQETAA